MSETRGGSRKGYSVRRHPNGNYSIAVPTSIGRLVAPETTFRFEVVEEGILLRVINESLPAWVQAQEGAA